MERGPLALFGAIVAVGLGPALWLGAQFGNLDLTPTTPPGLTSVTNQEPVPGGVGAADPDTADLAPDPTRVSAPYPVSPTTAPTHRVKVNRVTPAERSAEPSRSADTDPAPSSTASTSPETDPTPDDGTGTEQPAVEPSSDGGGQAEEPIGSSAITGMDR